MIKLIEDTYSVIGLGAFSIAAMGIRSVVDWLVTQQVGDRGDFPAKLTRMVEAGTITTERKEVIYAVFDAASAAAHRGHPPSEADTLTMLEVMERLLYEILVKPYHDKQEARKAEDLKTRTPPRKQ